MSGFLDKIGVFPSGWNGVLNWVKVSWVGELTIVVLIVQVSNRSFGSTDEIVDVLQIGDVRVEVVLEMLEHIQVLLHMLESSDSWPREGFVEKFPGLDLGCSDSEFLGHLHSIQIVCLVEFT